MRILEFSVTEAREVAIVQLIFEVTSNRSCFSKLVNVIKSLKLCLNITNVHQTEVCTRS